MASASYEKMWALPAGTPGAYARGRRSDSTEPGLSDAATVVEDRDENASPLPRSWDSGSTAHTATGSATGSNTLLPQDPWGSGRCTTPSPVRNYLPSVDALLHHHHHHHHHHRSSGSSGGLGCMRSLVAPTPDGSLADDDAVLPATRSPCVSSSAGDGLYYNAWAGPSPLRAPSVDALLVDVTPPRRGWAPPPSPSPSPVPLTELGVGVEVGVVVGRWEEEEEEGDATAATPRAPGALAVDEAARVCGDPAVTDAAMPPAPPRWRLLPSPPRDAMSEPGAVLASLPVAEAHEARVEARRPLLRALAAPHEVAAVLAAERAARRRMHHHGQPRVLSLRLAPSPRTLGAVTSMPGPFGLPPPVLLWSRHEAAVGKGAAVGAEDSGAGGGAGAVPRAIEEYEAAIDTPRGEAGEVGASVAQGGAAAAAAVDEDTNEGVMEVVDDAHDTVLSLSLPLRPPCSAMCRVVTCSLYLSLYACCGVLCRTAPRGVVLMVVGLLRPHASSQ